MTEDGCGELLAELAYEYERSRRFLAELEESLKADIAEPPEEPEEPRGCEALSDPDECAVEAGDKPCRESGGFKEKLARLFNRKSSSLGRAKRAPVVENDVVVPRRASVISLSFDPTSDFVQNELPQRSTSYAVAPSFPRQSLELRQQGLEQRRESANNLGALRRRSVEQPSFSGIRPVSLEAALAGSSFKQSSQGGSPLSSAALSPSLSTVLPDITPQSPHSASQRQLQQPQQQRRASSGVQAMLARRSSFGPVMPLVPAEDGFGLPGHEAGMPHASSGSRRRSIESGASPFCTNVQLPPSPASPAGNTLSPTAARPSASLPQVGRTLSMKALGGSGAYSGVGGLRALSLTAGAAAPLTPTPTDPEDAAAATAMLSLCLRRSDTKVHSVGGDASGAAGVAGASSALSRLSTASLSITAAGIAGPADSPGNSSPQLTKFATPMRSRSMRYIGLTGSSRASGAQTASGMAPAGASAARGVQAGLEGPAGGGRDEMRRHSFRIDRVSGHEAAGEDGGLRRKSAEEGSCARSVEGAADSGFRGTVHII